MTETELLEALVAELKEYGEVFIEDNTIDDYPGITWIQIERALVYEMGEPLVMTYDMQLRGFKIRRVSPSKKSRPREGTRPTYYAFDEHLDFTQTREAAKRFAEAFRKGCW